MECVEIEDKIAQERAAMYESDLKCYRSQKKGYQATNSYFFQETNDCTGGIANEGGLVKINISSTNFIQIWTTLVFPINSTNGKMS